MVIAEALMIFGLPIIIALALIAKLIYALMCRLHTWQSNKHNPKPTSNPQKSEPTKPNNNANGEPTKNKQEKKRNE
jgi:hypothetical protein